MQLRYVKNLQAPADGMQKITAAAWSANSHKVAVVSTDRIVHLYDEQGEKQDRFSTKPGDKETKLFVVKALDFSPCSTKLAIAQSDNIVFVYKLGTEWKERKSICNKFPQTSCVTCLTWPSKHPNEIVFGLAEGRVKVGQLKANKAALLYATDSFVMCMTSGPDGNSVLSGHLDGSIHKFMFETENSGPITQKFCRVPNCSISCIGWGSAGICAAGNDSMVRFWTAEGRDAKTFDYNNLKGVKEFSCLKFNPSGESVVLGNFNRYFVYAWHARNREWSEVAVKEVPNLYTITSLCWRSDGSRLVMGTLCGSVELFDACIKRARYKGEYEFTYISLSQVIVKNLTSGSRIVLKSNVGFEIKKINVFQERYLVAHTPESLLLGDLITCKLSEIPWQWSGNMSTGGKSDEKYFFDNPQVCMIFKAGELSIVEYGQNEVLGYARTEHVSPHLISIQVDTENVLNDQSSLMITEGEEQKTPTRVIAYLLDVQTIRLINLTTQQILATINHDLKIDWLELNPSATRVLFRDKRRQLHLYNVETQTRVSLLNYCNYVHWVPGSDVVVAQNRNQLCVWYSILENTDRVTVHEIKGDVEDIERSNGRTFVTVDEGVNTVEYELDEALINFGSCLHRKQYGKAVDILEELPLTPETEAMWRSLAKVAMDDLDALPVVEQCYAVLGDVAKARYIHNLNQIRLDQGENSVMVQAKMAMLNKQYTRAEAILLDANQLEEAMGMYQELHKYDESIRLAEKKGHPNVMQLKNHYLQWLLSTQQEERAGELQEREGNYARAIELYLKGGMAAKAASLVQRFSNFNYTQELLQRIATALEQSGVSQKAGALYERMGMMDRAMGAYIQGNAFRQAVELAKQVQPSLVIQLEEQWGDYLVSQKQTDAAIHHYIEAGCSLKAIDSAMNARQWHKAEQLLESTHGGDASVCLPFYEKLAGFYEKSRQFPEAERSYLKSGKPQKAVQMYVEHQMFDKAYRVSSKELSQRERTDLYLQLAEKQEKLNKLSDAEQLYLAVNESDLAINMYKKREEYEQMLRLVSKFRKELLIDTYKHIASQYEAKGNLKRAEHYFVEAKCWTNAVSMYRQIENWDDAKRVAKQHGGKQAFEKVVLAQAHTVFKESGAEAGAQLLAKHGLTEIAIDYAVEHNNFEHAFELATMAGMEGKVQEIHLKRALAFEDEELFEKAEQEFLLAKKPKEAIDMYVHQRDWVNAMRIAENYDKDARSEVMIHQARDIASEGNTNVNEQQLRLAESLFVQGKEPELAVQMYSQRNMMNDAIRVCKKHRPQMLGDLVDQTGSFSSSTAVVGMGAKGDRGSSAGSSRRGDSAQLEEILDRAKVYEETGNYSRAIDAYLMVTEKLTSDKSRLEEIWESAVRIAMKHSPVDRYPVVCEDVAKRLNAMGRFEAAGQLFVEADMPKPAIEAYMSAQQWTKAQQIAQQSMPQMLSVIESRYKNDIVKTGDGDELIRKTGDVNTALDMYARQGDWNKCFALAEKQKNPELMAHYVLQHVKQLLQQQTSERIQEACKILNRYGAPPVNNQTTALYTVIAQKLLTVETNAKKVEMARELLFQVVMGRDQTSTPMSVTDIIQSDSELVRFLLVAHFMQQKNKNQTIDAKLRASTSEALLRYTTHIPVDRTFYEAGMGCKDADRVSASFLYLNRYLDIVDAIQDDMVQIDNADFANTDIPNPQDVEIPEHPFLSDDKNEEIRELVLGWSVSPNIEQKLPTRNCDNCSKPMYAAGLKCFSCGNNSVPCVVTGQPVLRQQQVQCTNCGSYANREDWMNYIRKYGSCPWCLSRQQGNALGGGFKR
ncbi:unnamed protein product [Amoebophrya sp. A120]|nr:unnamed protein product [Amoebophrya sp. A120]|eukprot:GSA120T00007462001.1